MIITFRNPLVSDRGREVVDHVYVKAGWSRCDVVTTALAYNDCSRVPGVGGDAENPLFVRYYVDDGILVEVRCFNDGHRCLSAVHHLRLTTFICLDLAAPWARRCWNRQKNIDWATCLEVLGWIVDNPCPCRPIRVKRLSMGGGRRFAPRPQGSRFRVYY